MKGKSTHAKMLKHIFASSEFEQTWKDMGLTVGTPRRVYEKLALRFGSSRWFRNRITEYVIDLSGWFNDALLGSENRSQTEEGFEQTLKQLTERVGGHLTALTVAFFVKGVVFGIYLGGLRSGKITTPEDK